MNFQTKSALIEALSAVSGYHIHFFSRTRPFTRALLQKRDLIGVEVGTFRGENALNMCRNLNLKRLYCVDSYSTFWQDGNTSDYVSGLDVAKRRLSPFRSKAKFIIQDSLDAADRLPDGLDFVYLDGEHTYSRVSRELTSYWPKVKKGGIIGGHDFIAKHIGVVRAVMEFAKANNLDVHGDDLDWWMIK